MSWADIDRVDWLWETVYLEGDVICSEETTEPGDDWIEELDEGQERDQVGDDVHDQEDGVGRTLSRSIQGVSFCSAGKQFNLELSQKFGNFTGRKQ